MKSFKILSGLGILFLLNFISIHLVSFLHIHFPSTLVGMIVLASLMYFKVIPQHFVEDACKLLLDNMGLFFVPLLVGIVIYFHLLSQNAVPILFTIVITTFAIICVTGIVVEFLMKRKNTVE